MQIRSLYQYYLLTRVPLSLAVSFSSFTAMVFFARTVTPAMLLPIAGIFMLSCGASAFNQYQEYHLDEKMERTRRRPLPSRRLTTSDAVRVSSLLFTGGSVVLIYWSDWITVVLGLINIFWYNGVYTWLKRKTAFAVVPGAITGVIPVLMGWTSAGGHLTDPPVLFLSLFLFLWQMPHFWLLTLKYGNEYRDAGFPVLTDHFSDAWMKRITVAWLLGAVLIPLLMIHFGIIRHPLAGFSILTGMVLLLSLIIQQLFLASKIRYRMIFIAANLLMFIVLAALIGDSLLA